MCGWVRLRHWFALWSCKWASTWAISWLPWTHFSTQGRSTKSTLFQPFPVSPSRFCPWMADTLPTICAESPHNSICHTSHHSSSSEPPVLYNKPRHNRLLPIDDYCSEFLVHLLAILETSRRSEVNDLQTAVTVRVFQQNVFWLQVSMHDAFLVTVEHCRENLFHYQRCYVFIKAAFVVLYLLEQVTSANVLLDQVKVLLILIELIHLNYVRMILHLNNHLGKQMLTNCFRISTSFDMFFKAIASYVSSCMTFIALSSPVILCLTFLTNPNPP